MICDKPLTLDTVPEAQGSRRDQTKTGKLFAVTHNYTGYPMVRQAREMIAQWRARRDPRWCRRSIRRTG